MASRLEQMLSALGVPGVPIPAADSAAGDHSPRHTSGAPTAAQAAAWAAERTEHAGDGPDVSPVTVNPNPSTVDEADPRVPPGAPAKPLGSPVPVASAAFTISAPAGEAGVSRVIVPASGDRPRRVVIRVGSEPVTFSPDRRDSGDVTTGDTSGYTVPASTEFETFTQGPIYGAAAGAWSVSVWVDHYPAPK